MSKTNPSQYTHVCIAVNIYGLLQYLLNHDEDIIMNKTHYFVGSAIPEEVRNRMPNTTYFPTNRISGFALLCRRIHKIKLALLAPYIYPELKHAKIYAQDHQYLASVLIRRSNYTFLCDSADILTLQMNEGAPIWEKQKQLKKSLKGKLEAMLYGHLTIHYFANNRYCNEILLERPNHSPVMENKKVILNSFTKLWRESSLIKQEFISQICNVTTLDVELFNSIDVLVLTQPFYDDSILTAQEHMELYTKIIAKYKGQTVLIKPHPRDSFDYKSYFQENLIYSKNSPMEVLVFMGVNLKIACTVCSTSVNCFTGKVTIDWIGTKVHPKIFNKLGDF